MADGRRSKAAAEGKKSLKDGIDEDSVIVTEYSSSESEIGQLRERWELASILNFLSVFEPVIGGDLRLTAEEIETGLIEPSSSLAQLHIDLLKGIPPVSKTLINNSDAWVTVLCKKLVIWWPWVAVGEIPLFAAKGEEISVYKELNPTKRLLILKALCEVRADQHDAVSYINGSLKNGIEISCFRKDKIGGDENGTSYWYEGNTVIGHRLYKEVTKAESKTKLNAKAPKNPAATCLRWETLATNLEEFQEVVDELSSSRVVAEVAVAKTIETCFLPDIEKFQKKKERALKRKQRQEKLLNDFRSYHTGFTRSCRNHRPVSYKFDEYDRAINEAIEVTKRQKTAEEQRKEMKHTNQGKLTSNGSSDLGTDSKESNNVAYSNVDKDGNVKRDNCLNGEIESNDDNDDDDSKRDGNGNDSESGNFNEEKDNRGDRSHSQKPFGLRWSKRLAGVASHPVVETRSPGTKNRLRQRPVPNSALGTIVLDSEDENKNSGLSGREDLSPVENSEEVGDI